MSGVQQTVPFDIPVPLSAFADVVRGTNDEVWLTLLRINNGAERHTMIGWRSLISRYGSLAAQ